MRKKLALFLCLAVVMGSMAGCGEKKETSSGGKEESEIIEEGTEEPVTKEEGTDEYPEDLYNEYIDADYGFKFYIERKWKRDESEDGPSPHAGVWKYEKKEGTYTLTQYKNLIVTKYSGDLGDEEQKERIDMSQYQDSTDILDLLIGNVGSELTSYPEDYPYNDAWDVIVTDYDVEILETKEINGCEVTKFEGTVTFESSYRKDDDEPDVYTDWYTAYGFKTEKTPVLLLLRQNMDIIDEEYIEDVRQELRDDLELIATTFKEGE